MTLKQNRKLQTGFQVGMERLLGAITHSAVPNERETLMRKQKWLVDTFENNISSLTNNDFTDPTDPTHPAFRSPAINEARSDLQKADMLEQEENRDASVPHYERLYWESVQEDGRVRHLSLVVFRQSNAFFDRNPSCLLSCKPKSRKPR